MELTKELALDLFKEKYDNFDEFDIGIDDLDEVYINDKLSLVFIEPFNNNIKHFVLAISYNINEGGDTHNFPSFIVGTLLNNYTVKYATSFKYIGDKKYRLDESDEDSKIYSELIMYLLRQGIDDDGYLNNNS